MNSDKAYLAGKTAERLIKYDPNDEELKWSMPGDIIEQLEKSGWQIVGIGPEYDFIVVRLGGTQLKIYVGQENMWIDFGGKMPYSKGGFDEVIPAFTEFMKAIRNYGGVTR